jgi:hypothetical protein
MSGNIRKIFAVEVQQIKSDKHTLASAEKQVSEYRSPALINAGNLAVEDGALNPQVFSDPCGEICKATEHVSVARDQFSFAILNVRQCSKTIDLQFRDKLV